jgi:hypothetical protein
MGFNRTLLHIPEAAPAVKVFDLENPLVPVAIADFMTSGFLDIISTARFSNGELAVLDLGGGLSRTDTSGGDVWTTDSRAGSETPRMVLVDKNDDVWVSFRNGQVSKFAGSSGLLIGRIATTSNAVLQASNATYIVAYDDVAGRIVTIDIVSHSIATDVLIQNLSANFQAVAVQQLGMFQGIFYIPVLNTQTNLYQILQISQNILVAVMPLSLPNTFVATLTDASGNVFAMDEFNTVARFLSNGSLYALYNLASKGRLQAMAFDQAGDLLYIVSDALFGQGYVHVLDPLVGVSTSVPYASAADFNPGDLTGYQRASVMATVPQAAPVVNLSLIAALNVGAETIVTGLPGAVEGADTVSSVALGNVTVAVAVDGSFSLRGPSVVPGVGAVDLSFVGPGGTTPEAVTNTVFTSTADNGRFIGTKFGLDGGFIKVYLSNAGSPLLTGQHFIRIKESNSGLYWNGSSLVAENGLYLPLVLDEAGVWQYQFLPSTVGDYTVFFEESPVFFQEQLQVTAEKTEIAQILSKVNQAAAPGAALLAPMNLFTDPTQFGGFIAGQLNRLQFLLNVLSFKANLVFPRTIEAITAQYSSAFLKQGDTPLVAFTIIDSVTGEPMDLTGDTVTFRARTQPGGPLAFSRQLDIIDAKNGQCSVRLTALDTGTVGNYLAEVVVVSADAVVLTTQSFNISINPNLG